MKDEILMKSSNSEFYLIIQIKVWIEIVCLSLKQLTHFLFSTTIIIWLHFFAPKHIILTMLNAGQFTCSISTATDVHPSTIFKLHSKECSRLQKSTGGCPKKLSASNIHHTIHLLFSQKTENVTGGGQETRSVFKRRLSRVEMRETRWSEDALTLRIAMEVEKATRLSLKTKETQLRVPTT